MLNLERADAIDVLAAVERLEDAATTAMKGGE